MKFTSPESAVLTMDFYIDRFCTRINGDVEEVYGVELYRDEEDVNPYNRLHTVVDAYVDDNIGKVFNMPLGEYINSTGYLKRVLRDVATRKMKEETELANRVKNNVDGELKNIEEVTKDWKM